jgi:hypothetical protein
MNEQIEIKSNLIEKTADSEFAERAKTLTMHMSQNWLRYCALLVTGTLTGIAGWNLTNNILMTAFLILLCEGASLFWTARTEDNGNGTQTWLSVAGTVIAWVSIAITDLASATIIANHADVKVFSMFREVPSWAQAVVTYVLPTLAFTHGVLGTAHYYFSEDAKLKRDLAKTEREARRAVAKAEAT